MENSMARGQSRARLSGGYRFDTLHGMIGLRRGTVRLSSHQKGWATAFEKEKKRLEKILGSVAVRIEHIGSTSVPGLPAKPLIDIAVGMSSMKDGRRYVRLMERAGYFWRPKWGRLDQHILFAKGNEKRRTHYIHLFRHGGAIWKRDLAFRDYLRMHPAHARRYAELKRRLARLYPDDRPAYTKKKAAFIRETLDMAREAKPRSPLS